MSLKILHILSSNFFAGSVSYAINLSEKQSSEGHHVFMITDRPDLSEIVPCIQLPVSNRSFKQRFKNVRFIHKFIREQNINIIHAHSRAASWIAYYARRGTHAALVSTIHGRQVKHSSLKRNDVFGERIIAICPNLINHLENEMKFKPGKLIYIPNGINLEKLKRYSKIDRKDDKIILSVVGRYNGPKGENIACLVKDVFPELLKQYPNLYINIAGGEWDQFPAKGRLAFDELRVVYRERIKYLGFLKEVHSVMADSDLIIGAGRVALEGILQDVPVFAIGEAYSHGIIAAFNISEAKASNFGDILPAKSHFVPNSKEILDEICLFLATGNTAKTYLKKYLKNYDLENIYPQIMHVYRQAIMQKNHPRHIPVLMYHRVPAKPIDTVHRTFVTKDKFERHLRFFRFRGLTSLTFKEYNEYANGIRPISEFPKKPFILTFDDGYEDNYHNMLPLTQKYGFKGVLFLLGNLSLRSNNWDIDVPFASQLMTNEQKQKFVETGWEIGAHTVSHSNLTQLDKNHALQEIKESKTVLEEKLQTPIISFAYPYGSCNDHVKMLVEECGFEFGILTDTGGLQMEEDRFAIFRVNMFPEENLFQLYKKTSSWYRGYYYKKRKK